MDLDSEIDGVWRRGEKAGERQGKGGGGREARFLSPGKGGGEGVSYSKWGFGFVGGEIRF